MTTESTSFSKFENNVCKSGDNKLPGLGGELLMTCKSSNDIFLQHSSPSDLSCFPSSKDWLSGFDAQVCKAPTHEKRGPVDVTVDEYGEMIGAKDTRGNTYTKNADGKWTRHFEYGDYKSDETVENLKVDCSGKLEYDYNDNERNVHVHHEQNPDGSFRFTNEFGKFAYDKNVRLLEAPAGEGHTRKFHYDDKGQLDQIDGRLGHWDRKVDADGQVCWVNKDSGAVWEGDFRVSADDMLEFKGRNGSNWAFTPWGTDVDRNAQK